MCQILLSLMIGMKLKNMFGVDLAGNSTHFTDSFYGYASGEKITNIVIIKQTKLSNGIVE